MVKPPAPRGFSYLGLLLLVALLSSAMATAGVLWRTQTQREREQELLFAGDQILLAIRSFREKTPAGQRARFPENLTELLDDKRWPTATRHLRRIYVDPMTGSTAWGLVPAPDGGVMGVHSRSTTAPFKRMGFASTYEQFAEARTIADWRFEYSAVAPKATSSASRVSAGSPQ